MVRNMLKTINMDPELWERLRNKADELTISYSSTVRLAIIEYLKEKENGNEIEEENTTLMH
jgi:hypothetical protein